MREQITDVAPGASTNPGILTQAFGKIKGQAELQLIDLQSKDPSLKVYSARPGFVDPSKHAEMKAALAIRKTTAMEKYLMSAAGPLFRLMPNHVSPTEELGKVLVDLALSDGSELSGEGVEKGRILEPYFLRQLFRESNATGK